VETVEQVRELVGAVHYRPIKGRLLEEFMSGARRPRPETVAFLKRFNRHNYLIIGIESVTACERLEELVAVEGVDGVFVGPHDISVSLEVPEDWQNPKIMRLIEDVIVRCRAAGVGVGVHVAPHTFTLEQVRRMIQLGMNWIPDSADVAWAWDTLTKRRAALGLPPQTPEPEAAPDVSTCIAPQDAQDTGAASES